MEVHTIAESISPQTLIISCEACGEVLYLEAANDEEVARQFSGFRCKKNCDRSYYSYITIGQILLGSTQNQMIGDAIITQNKPAAIHSG